MKEDIVYSYLWTSVASLNGFEMGENLRELLEEIMTSSQIEIAQEMANDCVAKEYKGC